MNRYLLSFIFGLLLPLVSAELARSSTLDRSGTGSNKFVCAIDLVSASVVSADYKATYIFKGKCTIVASLSGSFDVTIPNVPVIVQSKFWAGPDGIWASEAVKFEETALTTGAGGLTTRAKCIKDPFARGLKAAGCTEKSSSISNNVFKPPFEVKYVPKSYPLTAGLADQAAQEALKTGQAGSALTAAPQQQDLSDWDPMGQPTEAPAIEILKPTANEIVAADTSYYMITIKPKSGISLPPRIHLWLERLEETPEVVGDLTMPADMTHWWQPLHLSDWTRDDFPFPLPISSGLIAGKTEYYRIQLRGHSGSHYVGGPTPWVEFCVGSAKSCATSSKQIAAANNSQVYLHQELIPRLMKQPRMKTDRPDSAKSTSIQATASHPPEPGKLKPPPLAGHDATAIDQNGRPFGTERMATPSAGNRIAKADTNAFKIALPKLSVAKTSYSPAPLQAGQTITFGIEFKNSGKAASEPDAEYKISCTVLAGPGPCPVAEGIFKIGKRIDPNTTHSVSLIGANPAAAGAYKVSVSVPPDQRGRPHGTTLEVAAKSVTIPGSFKSAPVVQPKPQLRVPR